MNSVHFIFIVKINPFQLPNVSKEKNWKCAGLSWTQPNRSFWKKDLGAPASAILLKKLNIVPVPSTYIFSDKDEIFHELHEDGFRKMLDMMQPLKHVADPMQRLIAMGKV
jgi:hypothetical protein